MAQLVLLVVAAAWAAVLHSPDASVAGREPPELLGHRLPASAQHAAEHVHPALAARCAAWAARSPSRRCIARRPPVDPASPMHRQASVHPGTAAPPRTPTSARRVQIAPASASSQQFRSHGDPTGGQHRPHRQTHMARQPTIRATTSRRRRSNVLFVLVIATACSMFLAATTGVDGVALRVRPVVPGAVRLRVPARATPPA